MLIGDIHKEIDDPDQCDSENGDKGALLMRMSALHIRTASVLGSTFIGIIAIWFARTVLSCIYRLK